MLRHLGQHYEINYFVEIKDFFIDGELIQLMRQQVKTLPYLFCTRNCRSHTLDIWATEQISITEMFALCVPQKHFLFLAKFWAIWNELFT